MSQKKYGMIILLLAVSGVSLFPDVPPARVHPPDIPYFLESMQFQTLQMRIFPSQYAGMATDVYSDLTWNPAFILRQSKKSVYLDFNAQAQPSSPSIPAFSQYTNYYNYYSDSVIRPGWDQATAVNGVQTSPLYHFAAIIPLSSRVTVGFINRSLFDYGSFRSIPNYDWRGYTEWSNFSYSIPDLVPQRLDADENQQEVFGNQSELTIGFKLSRKIDLGFRLGYYTYRRDGNLYDSKEGIYPHSSLDNLDEESFTIDGHHVEAGIGVLFHLGTRTRLGIYGGLTDGKGSEETVSKDNTDTWSERPAAAAYYNIYRNFLDSKESYASDGKRPKVTVTLERDISSKLVFRSFLSYSWSEIDITGSLAAANTVSREWTYDYWVQNASHFRKGEYRIDRDYGLVGTGKNRLRHWRWFASLVYSPQDEWTLFGGLQLENYAFKQELEENAGYTSDQAIQYSLFAPETGRNYHTYAKIYGLEANYTRWSLSLPLGMRARLARKLHLILGADITLTLTDLDAEGRLLYPEKITRQWKNNGLIVDDLEIDRYEEYRSDPAKEFNRVLGHYFGLVYQLSPKIKLYFRSQGDILQTSNWALGMEMNW